MALVGLVVGIGIGVAASRTPSVNKLSESFFRPYKKPSLAEQAGTTLKKFKDSEVKACGVFYKPTKKANAPQVDKSLLEQIETDSAAMHRYLKKRGA